jgi:hypothetical protein
MVYLMFNVHCKKVLFNLFFNFLYSSFRLEQLDKTNEKLDGINKLSAKRYLDATRDFSSHTQMLITMKNDLDLIFKRIK